MVYYVHLFGELLSFCLRVENGHKLHLVSVGLHGRSVALEQINHAGTYMLLLTAGTMKIYYDALIHTTNDQTPYY